MLSWGFVLNLHSLSVKLASKLCVIVYANLENQHKDVNPAKKNC